jgi:precorrin-2 dehydrogenase/sirohydrochlorin ferrochelatase
MRYYPIYLDIRDRLCLVVGAGSVGTRKVESLLKCGARVKVISPEATPSIESLARSGKISLKKRAYRQSDLNDVFLVIGATDDQELNRRVSSDAGKLNLLCNIADRPEICNFILPSVVNRGDLTIAISTAGQSPAVAKTLRKELEQRFGTEYADFLRLMGAIRKKLLRKKHEPEVHKPLFEQLIRNDLLGLIRDQRTEDIDVLLRQILGEGYRYEELMQM